MDEWTEGQKNKRTDWTDKLAMGGKKLEKPGEKKKPPEGISPFDGLSRIIHDRPCVKRPSQKPALSICFKGFAAKAPLF